MKKVVKTKATSEPSAQFILCEDVREEARTKFSFMGVFTGNRIEIHNPAAPPGSNAVALLQSLAIVALFRGLEGKHEINVTITAPNGDVVTKNTMATGDMKANAVATVIMKFVAIPIPAFGRFRVEFAIKNEDFLYEFDVVEAPKAAAL